MTSKVRNWAMDRAAILKRRQLMVTAAMSTVTATAVTAQAQICLSIAEPDPPSCASREHGTEAEAPPRHWLAIGKCYEEQERDLERALVIYQAFLARTDGQPEFTDDRRRIQWTIGRIESILAAERGATRATLEAEDEPEPAPSVDPAADVEVIANPHAQAAPRSGGAASCGCETAGRQAETSLALATIAGLIALARRRRGPR